CGQPTGGAERPYCQFHHDRCNVAPPAPRSWPLAYAVGRGTRWRPAPVALRVLGYRVGDKRPPIVRLTWGELILAGFVGVWRQACGLQNNYQQAAEAERNVNAWERHVLGSICEIPVAKYFNLFWRVAINEIDQIDVGGFIEVRGVTRKTDGLVIRPKDLEKKAALPFVLVYADPPDFELVGWIVARDAKQEKFVTD